MYSEEVDGPEFYINGIDNNLKDVPRRLFGLDWSDHGVKQRSSSGIDVLENVATVLYIP
jgi:hypothetical protein